MGKVKIAKRVESHRIETKLEREFKEELVTSNKILHNLRKHYHRVTDHILGERYYNTAGDVYSCDRIIADDLIKAYDQAKYEFHYGEFFGGLFIGFVLACVIIILTVI